VIREGKTRSVDPNHIVPGDVLIVGPGDQCLADGEAVGSGRMVVDESMVNGHRGWQTKAAGDPVYAGSFCISGRGAYRAEKVGDERLIVSRLGDMQVLAKELTPLERLVDRILRVLMVLVAVFAVLLLLMFFRLDLGVPVDLFSDAAAVIFNIAPSGLFLMILVTYTTGTADLAKLGALVHRARSVESLAEATVICFAEAGILTGTMMELQPVQDPGDPDHLPESRIRQILGDYGRSTSAPNQATRVLANTFEGNRRPAREEAPFLTALGWSAITFDAPDLRGVYVLGEPAIIEGQLLVDVQDSAKKKERSSVVTVRQPGSPLRRWFQRGDKARGEEARPSAAESVDTPSREATDLTEGAGGDEKSERFFRRWAKRLGQRLRRAEPEREQSEVSEAADVVEAALLFAYSPELVPLHDGQGHVQLPEGLIPLCELRYAQSLRPEAVEIVQVFAQTGVSIKAFASDEPDQILTLFQQAGFGGEKDTRRSVGAISGRDLEQLDETEWAQAATEHAIFSHLTPPQAGTLVRTLRACGESVAVVGDGVTDLPALQEANLAIARQTSTQAALGVADVVVMGNSPEILLRVLEKGQRIVHGLLDVLKLNLTQVVYLALLIIAIQLWSAGFPYAAAQASAIAILTVTLPSVGLSFWAVSGRVSSAGYGRILARFVAPAAVSMAGVGFVVYVYFLGQTRQLAYAQLAVTYMLIYAGLLLAVFVNPPWRPSSGEEKSNRKRDWRMARLALFLGIVAFFLPAIPAAQEYLKLDWLQQPADYGVVGLAVMGWALLLGLIWWLVPRTQSEGRKMRTWSPEAESRSMQEPI
jgi:magnesium-transporting ATPase (P-type)